MGSVGLRPAPVSDPSRESPGRHLETVDAVEQLDTFAGLFGLAEARLGPDVAGRLRFLKSSDDRLGEQQEPMSLRAAASALAFLLEHRSSPEPDLVMGDSGNLVVEWFESDDRQVAVEFLPDGRCLFGVLYDDERVSGMTHAATLASRLAPYPVRAWFNGGR